MNTSHMLSIMALSVLGLTFPSVAQAFSFNDVALQAQVLAKKPWSEPENKLPKVLRELTYDQFRDIRFRPERSLWRGNGSPFEIQFFHPGFHYTRPVKIHTIHRDSVQALPFRSEDFNYGSNKFDKKDFKDVGYAGFRVHYPVNQPQYKDELAVFLGASYFRALGKKQLYGSSARGLAVDTALMSGEEFPSFTEFWIVSPPAGSHELEILALLESKRLTGAYRFLLHPGDETRMDVRLKLFPRDRMEKLGVAPLTSMFLFGENQRSETEDYRPEVHDSDGLLLHTQEGEWVWRPLVNPERLLVTAFELNNPHGFGLMQRDRDFSHYEDLEARYERRPSVWVAPKGNWGKGRIELVQIPTPDETNDNIVAYWVPAQQPEPGKSLELQYRVLWQLNNLIQPPLAWTAQTRRGYGYRREPDDSLRFVVDFDPTGMRQPPLGDKLEAAIWAGGNAEVLEKQSFPNEVSGGWRVSFRLKRKDEDPVEMRVTLRAKNKVVSETWSYVLP
jgi:periplasmic glucans biosynthesis protein